jgi:hypothetical protein
MKQMSDSHKGLQICSGWICNPAAGSPVAPFDPSTGLSAEASSGALADPLFSAEPQDPFSSQHRKAAPPHLALRQAQDKLLMPP